MPDLYGKRILVVDDDASIRDFIQAALISKGFATIVARDGCEALMRAERDAPDLVILDVMIPRRNGLVVLKRIQSWVGRRPKVMLVSGDCDPRHKAFAEAHGAAAYLQKPFEVEALLQEVDRILADAFLNRFAAPDQVPVAGTV